MINKRYIIGKKLGEGRSKVFNLIDTEFPDRVVAGKFISPNASEKDKQFFRDEYFILKNLDHPNIIKAYEQSTVVLKEDDDSEVEVFDQFITMEQFSGINLLSYKDVTQEQKLIKIVKQICSALYYLHQSNYIYYDLKPDNILISEIKNNPVVKLIDLGLAKYVLTPEIEQDITGTAYYIAPELLKKEQHSYNVDLYSLGIMMYRLVYGRFPFTGESEIEIYKAQVEGEVEFLPTFYSKKLIDVIIKLLKKDPAERYDNALQVISDLGVEIDVEIAKELLPAKIFSDRKDAWNILNTYLIDSGSNEVFVVRGYDGAGKTSLLQEFNFRFQNSVFIENTRTKAGIDAVKFIFNKIILNEHILFSDKNIIEKKLELLFNGSVIDYLDTVKSILNNLSEEISFLVVLDDFNLYDEFTRQILTEILPILQVKHIKVILSESSEVNHFASLINNVCEVSLSPFTEYQLSEFIDLSYYNNFPKNELKKNIFLYSDLLPGNIKEFIKDLILLDIIKYSPSAVTFSFDEELILALQNSHEEIFRLRLSGLNSTELKLVQIISAFDISVEQTILSSLLDVSPEMLKDLIVELERKNIISFSGSSSTPQINSFTFKKYVYNTIGNKKRFHIVLANSISRLFPDFNLIELARQYELAGEFEKSVSVLLKEINRAEEISAYAYKKSLLDKCISITLSEETKKNLTYELIKTLYKLNDYKSVLDLMETFSSQVLNEQDKEEYLFIKGSCLVEIRDLGFGKKILEEIETSSKNNELVERILIELAYIEFDLSNYSRVEEICNRSLSSSSLTLESRGRYLNLLSRVEFFVKNDFNASLKKSLDALEIFNKAGLPRRVAGMYVNIGSIYDALNMENEASEYWDKALEINRNIGNLEQEATVLLNQGLFYEKVLKFDDAIENWKKSESIYKTIGNSLGLGFIYYNLSDIYLKICEYQKSLDMILEAEKIFFETQSIEDQINSSYIKAKIWFIIGDFKEYELAHTEFTRRFVDSNTNVESLRIHRLYLEMLSDLLNSSVEQNNNINIMISECISQNETNLLIEFIFILCEHLIEIEKFNEAQEYLMDSNFKKIIGKNEIFAANYEYLLGRISYFTRSEKLNSPLEYFENAYSLIEDKSIQEITWKILFSIAEIYWERGNYHKAKTPRIYAFELINMIADGISDVKIKNAYLNKPVRKKAIDKLLIMSSTSSINEYR